MMQSPWRTWEDSVFEEARATQRPVLLLITASWCRFCRELEEDVLADPEVAAQVERHYLPVQVDKDKRPDVDQRYNQGGWPTLAFLTPEGELITGGSDLTAEEVRALITEVAAHYQENRVQLEVDLQQVLKTQRQVDSQRSRRRAALEPAIVSRIAASILQAFDRRHGGFGTGQKFPHPEAIDFAILHYAKTRDAAWGELVQKSLSAMAEGRLRDPVSGAFFRYCGTRNWTQPHTEVLLETQVGLLRNYLEAYQLFGREDFRKVAQEQVAFLEGTLRDPETGAWFGSQDADDVYYSLDARQRQDRKPPRVEPTCYTPSVAQCVSSLFKAGRVLGDERAHAHALQGLHFLLERCYAQGRGMYHYFDDSRHILGLLSDQIFTARALIHAVFYTGDNDYIPVLEDLIGTIVKKQSARHGGFYDIPPSAGVAGPMRRRHASLHENGVMAEVLIRAHALTCDARYLDLARSTLQAFAGEYQGFGYLTATYARAVELYFQPPILAAVVGAEEDPVRRRMLHEAQRAYAPSKVVLALDPARDQELLQRHGYPARGGPCTYLCLERSCVAELSDPDQIAARLAAVEERRAEKLRAD